MKVKFIISVDTTTGEFEVVNSETGEIKKVDLPKEKKSSSKKTTKKDENPNPTLTLEENKYILNSAAVELLEVEPEDRLDIKYEKQGKGDLIPVIGTNEAFGTKAGKKSIFNIF